MFCLVHGFAKEHEQCGHEQEYRQHAAQNCLDQADSQVHTQPELHKGHGRQTGYSGQTAGKDFRDGRGNCLDDSLSDWKILVLLFVPITL